jgi:surface antigen
VLLGGLLGSEIGRSLDKADQAYAAQSHQQTMETAPVGQTNSWVNPDSGNQGSYTPVKTYQANNGQYCREFQQTITVGGQTESAYGTACRQPDGVWQIASN